jgi:hypothetical protein
LKILVPVIRFRSGPGHQLNQALSLALTIGLFAIRMLWTAPEKSKQQKRGQSTKGGFLVPSSSTIGYKFIFHNQLNMQTGISTETSGRWPIPNQQNFDIVGNENTLVERFVTQYEAKLRTAASGRYNCHGLTFGSRRTCIDDATSIVRILVDDGYKLVDIASVMPGDVVLYYDPDGTVSHSGIVALIPDGPLKFPQVVSKWGVAGAEYLHWVHKSPYGVDYKFYRVDHSGESIILSKIILGQ